MFNFFNFVKGNKLSLPDRNLDEIKSKCVILFIDDKSFLKTVNRLKTQDGWRNTSQIKDVQSLDQSEIVKADVLFVDIQGVGKKLFPIDEGLGLIKALRAKYQHKKIVMYSSESRGHDAFHDAMSAVDGRLRKTADHYEFQKTVEEMAMQIYSLEYTITKVNEALKECGVILTNDEIIRKISSIRDNGDLEGKLKKVFNIQNAAAVASIIQLFLSK